MPANRVHPTAVLDGDVVLGAGNVINAFAVITGPIVLGDDNWIGAHAIVGAAPEIRGLSEPDLVADRGRVLIGNRNIVREAAQIHRGSSGDTVIGDDCFVMNQVYVAHDCLLGSGVTIASGVRLAGHVQVGDEANIGLGAVVHQRRVIAAGAMVGMGSVVTRDIPAYVKAYGNPARVHGVNSVGLQRRGIPIEQIASIEDALRSGDDVAMAELLEAAGVR